MPPKKRTSAASKAKKSKTASGVAKKTTVAKESPNDPQAPVEGPASERPTKRARTEESAEADGQAPAPVAQPPLVVATAEKDTPETAQIPKLTGTFDLYAMELAFLSKVYCPSKSSKVKPEELYREILTYQAKSDNTARVYIPEDYAKAAEGTFTSQALCDPMEDLPFDITILGLNDAHNIALAADYGRPDDAWGGTGIEGRLTIKDPGCGIKRASGTFKMRPLWKKVIPGGETLELFEGSFLFHADYTKLYERKGHGSDFHCPEVPFWAVRGAA